MKFSFASRRWRVEGRPFFINATTATEIYTLSLHDALPISGGRRGPRHPPPPVGRGAAGVDRKSTRLNSSHMSISYAVFCLKKKKAGMSLMKKLRLYDGEDIEDFKQKDIKELQDEAVREGMDGISQRYVINRLSNALVKQNVTCINPIDALRALKDGLDQHTSITREEREHYLAFISEARKEYDDMARKEVQRAFVYSYEESARTLLINYLD